MEKIREFVIKFWPLLFLIGVWLAFSYPYFLQQKVPYPSKYQVTFFSPWSYYQEFAGPVKNNAMPDVVTQIYPWKHFTIEQLKNGQIAFWNPYSFAGTPHLANVQSTVFSPVNLLFLILPFVDAWIIAILLQPLFAGVFLYLFMREIGVSKGGSVLSSIAFMFCGFLVTWMAYGTLGWALLFLPLILFAIERMFRKNSWKFLPVISLGIASSFFSGHVQTSLYITIVVALYLLYKGLVSRDVKRFLLVMFFFFGGLALVLLQLLPTVELLSQSARNNLVYQGGQIPLSYLVTIFAPDFFGNPVTRNDWLGYYAERASFIGIIPLLFAFFAFLRPKKSIIWFFGIIGILAVGFASDTFLRNLLFASNLPVFATSIPSRLIVIFSFSFAVLAGFGFDTVRTLLTTKKTKLLIGMFIAFGAVFAIYCFFVISTLPSDKIILAQKNILIPLGLFFLLFVVSVVTILFKQLPFTKIAMINLFAGLVLVLVAADSLRFATKWMPFDERTLVFPDLPVIHSLKKHVGHGRVFGSLGAQVEAYYGIGSLEGYDPLYIQRYGEFIRAASTGEYLPAERSLVRLARKGMYTERVLELLGVSLIFHPKADTKQTWAFPVWQDNTKYTKIYEDEKFQLYKHNAALPRVKLFYSSEVIKDDKQLLKRFYTENFDYRSVLLLEETPEFPRHSGEDKGRLQNPDSGPSNSAGRQARMTKYTPNKITIAVETDTPALLFLSDSYYPQWKAKVNGKETNIYRADYAFRAVVVPEGKSTVEFFYNGLF